MNKIFIFLSFVFILSSCCEGDDCINSESHVGKILRGEHQLKEISDSKYFLIHQPHEGEMEITLHIIFDKDSLINTSVIRTFPLSKIQFAKSPDEHNFVKFRWVKGCEENINEILSDNVIYVLICIPEKSYEEPLNPEGDFVDETDEYVRSLIEGSHE